MTRKVFIALAALAAATLSGGAGIASDSAPSAPSLQQMPPPQQREKVLALFISALTEKNPDRQCLKLIDVIAADPDNSAPPFAAFVAAFKKARDIKTVVAKYNAMHGKNPAHPILTLHAIAMNSAAGASPEELLKKSAPLHKLSPGQLIRHSCWDTDCTRIFLKRSAEFLVKLGRYAELHSLCEKWSSVPAPHRIEVFFALTDLCYTAAARCFAMGDAATGKALEKCFNKNVAFIETLDTRTPNRKRDAGIILFYSNFNKLYPGKALKFVRQYDRSVGSAESNHWLLTTAMESGSIDDFNKAAAVILEMNPRFNPAELRFKTFVNARNFKAAQAELGKIPQAKHFEMQTLLLTAKKDWKGMNALLQKRLQDGTPPDMRLGVLLLTAAEKLHSRALFRQAEKILAPHQKLPGIANALGYISAELELDLPKARQQLQKALAKEPRNYAFLDSMAWIAFKEKRYAEAEKWIRKAFAQMNPREGMSVVLEHAGDIAAAQRKSPRLFYQLALKYAPFDSEADVQRITRKMKACK